jgi:uncharacterized small protein (DUF1192 family)
MSQVLSTTSQPMKLRILRDFLGIVLSVKIEMDEKMHHLKEEIAELQTQLEHYKNTCKEQEVRKSRNSLNITNIN